MDKKNVQIWNVQNTLTDENFYLDKENLWSQIKPNIFNFITIFFYYFWEK